MSTVYDEPFRNMVSKYLDDNSYILCMVCSMLGAAADSDEVKSMAKKHRTRRTFWVLTHYDSALQSSLDGAMSARQAADDSFQTYRDQIVEQTECQAVFPHAAHLLWRPDDAKNKENQKILELEEAQQWFEHIRTFVTKWFKRNHVTVWDDQAQDAKMLATALVQAFDEYLQSSEGKDEIMDNFEAEMTAAVNEAMNVFEQEVENALQEAFSAKNLKKLGERAVEATSQYMQRQKFIDAVAESISKELQDQLKTPKCASWEKACEQVLERARALFEKSGTTSLGYKNADANMKYYVAGECAPYQAATLLWTTVSAQSTLLASETGVAALSYAGVTVSVPAIALGVVVAGVLIFAVASTAHLSPFWTRAEALQTVIDAVRAQNPSEMLQRQWSADMLNSLKELLRLLRTEYKVKLRRGSMTEEDVRKICPDKGLAEQIQKRVYASSDRIKNRLELLFAKSLGEETARNSLEKCRPMYHQRQWKQIAESTEHYGKPCLADAIPGRVYADLLHLRALALLRAECYQEAKETIEVFLDSFPGLILPEAYAVAVYVLPTLPRAPDVGLKANPDSINLLQSRINDSLERMSQQGVGTMPELVEIWYVAIVASFQTLSESSTDQADELLRKAITDFVQRQMKTQMKTICSRLDLVPSMINSVQLLLEAVPPQFLATPVQTRLISCIQTVVRDCFQDANIEGGAYSDFRCQLYETNAVNVPEGWILALGQVDRRNPPSVRLTLPLAISYMLTVPESEIAPNLVSCCEPRCLVQLGVTSVGVVKTFPDSMSKKDHARRSPFCISLVAKRNCFRLSVPASCL